MVQLGFMSHFHFPFNFQWRKLRHLWPRKSSPYYSSIEIYESDPALGVRKLGRTLFVQYEQLLVIAPLVTLCGTISENEQLILGIRKLQFRTAHF